MRITTSRDAERLAENIYANNPNITDRQSFNESAVAYLEGTDALDNKALLNNTYTIISRNIYKKSDDKQFKKARGKDLSQDRQTTSKNTTTSRKEYIKKGARNIDLVGFDTKRRILDKPILYKNKIIFVEETQFKIKGKTVKRLRNKQGRFVKTK